MKKIGPVVGLSDAGDYAFYFFNTNFNIISNAIIA